MSGSDRERVLIVLENDCDVADYIGNSISLFTLSSSVLFDIGTLYTKNTYVNLNLQIQFSGLKHFSYAKNFRHTTVELPKHYRG